MGKTTAELSDDGVTIPLIIIDNCEDGQVIKRKRHSLKQRSKSSDAFQLPAKDSESKDPPDGSHTRPKSASVFECVSRQSAIERVTPKRSCSFSSIGSKDTVCSCSCENACSELKSTDGVNGQNMASFYQLWKRKPVNDIASKSKLEPPSWLKRSDKYRHCGCFTREHARKLSKSPCRCN